MLASYLLSLLFFLFLVVFHKLHVFFVLDLLLLERLRGAKQRGSSNRAQCSAKTDIASPAAGTLILEGTAEQEGHHHTFSYCFAGKL